MQLRRRKGVAAVDGDDGDVPARPCQHLLAHNGTSGSDQADLLVLVANVLRDAVTKATGVSSGERGWRRCVLADLADRCDIEETAGILPGLKIPISHGVAALKSLEISQLHRVALAGGDVSDPPGGLLNMSSNI